MTTFNQLFWPLLPANEAGIGIDDFLVETGTGGIDR